MSDAKAHRFWAKVVKQATPCWTWTAGQLNGGYGQFKLSADSVVSAHRFAYELVRGPIPDGLTIDHLCKNRLCVNPEHLEAVTMGDNIRRATSSNREKTHCANGHEYNSENTIFTKQRGNAKHRICKICRNAAAKRQRERLNTIAPVPTLTHNSIKTHCKRGHEFTLANTYLMPNGGGRRCLACRRVREYTATKRPLGRQKNVLQAATILAWMRVTCSVPMTSEI
jgi:hypothetical protein